MRIGNLRKDFALKVIAKQGDLIPFGVLGKRTLSEFRRSAKPHNSGHIFRSAAPIPLLRTAADERLPPTAAPHISAPTPLGP